MSVIDGLIMTLFVWLLQLNLGNIFLILWLLQVDLGIFLILWWFWVDLGNIIISDSLIVAGGFG